MSSAAQLHPTAADRPLTPGLGAEFVFLAAVWGASFLFMRQAVVEFGPLPTAGLRVAIAALALLAEAGCGLLERRAARYRGTEEAVAA